MVLWFTIREPHNVCRRRHSDLVPGETAGMGREFWQTSHVSLQVDPCVKNSARCTHRYCRLLEPSWSGLEVKSSATTQEQLGERPDLLGGEGNSGECRGYCSELASASVPNEALDLAYATRLENQPNTPKSGT